MHLNGDRIGISLEVHKGINDIAGGPTCGKLDGTKVALVPNDNVFECVRACVCACVRVCVNVCACVSLNLCVDVSISFRLKDQIPG